MTDMTRKDILEIGLNTLQIEIDAIKFVKSKLSDSFIDAVEAIYNCKGRVILTGMGKSGQIAKKIAATLASTGTPSYFLHPAEGVHGDLGMIVKGDIVLALSNSGETEEIKRLLPIIKRLGIILIAIVGETNSTLAKFSDYVIDSAVEKEACSLNLAPTASTTAALALGDAIAIALVSKKGFKTEDFALLHPSGVLGKKLLTTVKKLMHQIDEIPSVKLDASIEDTTNMITAKGFGSTAVIDENSRLIGIVTDGDIRRAVTEKRLDTIFSVKDIMTYSPKTVLVDELAATAVMLMERYKITSLYVLDNNENLVGLLHLQDLLKHGII